MKEPRDTTRTIEGFSAMIGGVALVIFGVMASANPWMLGIGAVFVLCGIATLEKK